MGFGKRAGMSSESAILLLIPGVASCGGEPEPMAMSGMALGLWPAGIVLFSGVVRCGQKPSEFSVLQSKMRIANLEYAAPD